MYPLFGKPLIQWSIDACKKSKYLNSDNIFISSEDDEILEFSKSQNVKTIRRPDRLSRDETWTQDVLKHASDSIDYSFDILVRVQANSPQIESEKIDECIEKLIENKLAVANPVAPVAVLL